MIFSKFFLNKKYESLRAVAAFLLAARIILNFQIIEPARTIPVPGNAASVSFEASKNFIQIDVGQQKKENQNRVVYGSLYLTRCDEASVKPPKIVFLIFKSSVLFSINFSAFLSSHFSTDT